MHNGRSLIGIHPQPGSTQVHRAAEIMYFKKNFKRHNLEPFFLPKFYICSPATSLCSAAKHLCASSWKLCQPCFNGAEKYLLLKETGHKSNLNRQNLTVHCPPASGVTCDYALGNAVNYGKGSGMTTSHNSPRMCTCTPMHTEKVPPAV